MLFLIGHGLVVGRDAFLPDDNPNSGISLVELGTILGTFQKTIRAKGGVLELIGLHSCSMSAVEVAYQLKGKAKYMMASEGLSFVGAWPYRQMLQKIFCAIDYARQAKVDLANLVKGLHELCVHNSADFIFAGYSSDLCLCSLDPQRVEALTAPIQDLAKTLRSALEDDRGKELILLAHWKSQSYFQEAYTDLYDFCLCLSKSCSDSASNVVQQAMKRACGSVIEALTPGETSKGPIIEVDFFGPDSQYSYGLSIYFPWFRPIEDASEPVIRNYKTYAFVNDLHGNSWLGFLKAYFKKTLRSAREIEPVLNPDYDCQEALTLASSSFRPIGFQTRSPYYGSSMLTGKVNVRRERLLDFLECQKLLSRLFNLRTRLEGVFAGKREEEKNKTDHHHECPRSGKKWLASPLVVMSIFIRLLIVVFCLSLPVRAPETSDHTSVPPRETRDKAHDAQFQFEEVQTTSDQNIASRRQS